MPKKRSTDVATRRVLESSPLDVEQTRKWLGLTQTELGTIVGRDRRSVARWAGTGGAKTSARGEAARDLRRLARIQFLLADLVDADEAQRWLRSPSPGFRGEAPIDLLETARIDDVIAALEALADGGTY
jgi:uncharacterized protein (DUF2384 family)